MKLSRTASTSHISNITSRFARIAPFIVLALFCSPAISFGAYAQSVVEFHPGNPTHSETAPIENILGAPDIGANPWNSTGSVGNLGSVVVDMGPDGFSDMPGPDIFLWYGGWQTTSFIETVEGCRLEASDDGVEFHLVADLPHASDVSPPVPLISRSVDLADSGLAWGRYLRITDTGTDPSGGGLELNAIEAVPEPATCTFLLLGGAAGLMRRRRART